MSICLSVFSLCPLLKVCPSLSQSAGEYNQVEDKKDIREEGKSLMLPTHRASVENDKKRFFKRKKETKKRERVMPI